MNPQDQQQPNPTNAQSSPNPQTPEYSQSAPQGYDPNVAQQNYQQGQQTAPGQPQVVYMTRPHDPPRQEMSAEQLQRHEECKKKFPKLNLSEGEYVIALVKRHPIGLIQIWAAVAAVVIALFALVAIIAYSQNNASVSEVTSATTLKPEILAIPAVLLSLLAVLFAVIASFVYRSNDFYLTNESVIQHIQTSLFNMREQTISLGSIEDVSYAQNGIASHIFNYGQIRLSTVGDEDTYTFNLASTPHKQVVLLNNAVESFKLGRPVQG